MEANRRPLHVFRSKTAVFLGYPDGVRRLAQPELSDPGSSGIDPMEDEDMFPEIDSEDMFDCTSEAKRPRLQPLPSTHSQSLDVLYKYKVPAVAFTDFKSNLCSLHQKSPRMFYLELARIGTWSCVNPCLAKIELESTPEHPDDAPWIASLSMDNVVPEVKSELKPDWVDRSHLILVKLSGHELFAIPIGTGDVTSSMVQLPKILDVTTKLDIYLQLYHYHHVDDLLHEHIVDRILRHAQVILNPRHNYVASDAIREIFPFPEGFLILLTTGKLWQFWKEGEHVRKHLLPIPFVALVHVDSSAMGTFLSRTLDAFECRLPFQVPDPTSASEATTEMSSPAMIQEIIDNSDEIKTLNQLRGQQEKVLVQLKIAAQLQEQESSSSKLFTTDWKINPVMTFGILQGFELAVKVKNVSDHTFLGEFWSIQTQIRPQHQGGLIFYQTYSIPKEFSPQSPWVFTMSLPKEMVNAGNVPLKFQGALVFQATYNSNAVIQVSNIWSKSKLTSIDFITVKSEQGEKIEAQVGETLENLVQTWTLEHHPGLLREIVTSGTSKLTTDLQPDLLRHFSHIVIFSQIRESELSTFRLSLFGQDISLTVSEDRWTFLCPDSELIQGLRRDVYDIKRRYYTEICDKMVEISKKLCGKVFELQYELSLLQECEDPSDEDLSIFQKCQDLFDLDVISRLG